MELKFVKKQIESYKIKILNEKIFFINMYYNFIIIQLYLYFIFIR